MQNVSIKIAEKIKTPVLGSINVFQKLWCVWDNVKKYYTAGQATNDCTIWSRKGVIWLMEGKNTDTTSNVEYLLLFHGNNGYTNIPYCYIIRIVPFL
jgi:hypothetical protein